MNPLVVATVHRVLERYRVLLLGAGPGVRTGPGSATAVGIHRRLREAGAPLFRWRTSLSSWTHDAPRRCRVARDVHSLIAPGTAVRRTNRGLVGISARQSSTP
jgi:hypothetical protein